jgi:large subunit ribosomal protein L22
MTSYSFNQDRQDVVLAKRTDVNASFKDLSAVCDAIRYKSAQDAMRILDSVIKLEMPVQYRRNNKHMGARHELGGSKGRWPRKCAVIVKKLLKNALAAAKSKGITSDMYVVHSSANKTMIARRTPPKGILVFGLGRYGPGNTRYSDLEFAKIELGLASNCDKLSKRIRHETRRSAKEQRKKAKAPSKKGLPAVEPAAEKAELAKQPDKPSTAVAAVSASAKVV